MAVEYLFIDLNSYFASVEQRLPELRGLPVAVVPVMSENSARIAGRVGPYLKCSIGLAPNRLLAKVATDMEKPTSSPISSARWGRRSN